VERDKIGRLYVQQGNVRRQVSCYFPRDAPFLSELEAELLVFPQGRHDDQVDSITQALAYDPLGYDHEHALGDRLVTKASLSEKSRAGRCGKSFSRGACPGRRPSKGEDQIALDVGEFFPALAAIFSPTRS